MDFLGISVWIWETLVLMILPTVSIMLAAIFIFKIIKAAQISASKWIRSTMPKRR